MLVFIYDNGCNLKNYVNAVKLCNHKPVLSKNIKKAKNCDALILTGGGDVAPFLYGKNLSKRDKVDLFTDISELNLLSYFYQSGKKILGICKGMQLINVFLGGTLIKKVPYHYNKNYDLYHNVNILENCPIYKVFSNKIIANSCHNQAVNKLGENLIIGGQSNDGVIEIVYHEFLPILATQFHPERISSTFTKLFFDFFFNDF